MNIGELIRINKEIAKRDVNIDIGKTFEKYMNTMLEKN